MTSQPLVLKCVLLGDTGAGKSSLASRWIHGRFDPDPGTTIGAAYLTRRLTVENRTVKIELWDTAGQERYRALIPMYYRSASVAILVFDATEPPQETIRQVQEWIECLESAAPKAIIAVAGNKCDLCETILRDKPRIPNVHADVAFWTSAKTNENVDTLFVEAIQRAALVKTVKATDTPTPPLNIDTRHQIRQRCTSCRP